MGIRHCGAVRCAPEAAEQRTPKRRGDGEDVRTEPPPEELVFRGALLRLLRPLGEHPANLCQAVLFAALHGTLTEKCYALGMGLIFGWAAEQTDSPAPGVVLHILNNGLVLARALAERGMG